MALRYRCNPKRKASTEVKMYEIPKTLSLEQLWEVHGGETPNHRGEGAPKAAPTGI